MVENQQASIDHGEVEERRTEYVVDGLLLGDAAAVAVAYKDMNTSTDARYLDHTQVVVEQVLSSQQVVGDNLDTIASENNFAACMDGAGKERNHIRTDNSLEVQA